MRWGVLLAGVTVPLGCTAILGADHTYELRPEAEAAASSSGSSGGSGGSGGGCGAPGDCPDPMNECVTVTCGCALENIQSGTELKAQTPGDCKVMVCDGNGGITSEVEETDFTDDARECTLDACDKGMPVHAPKKPGAGCDQNGGKVCDDKGDCVECLTSADCATPGALCSSGACVPSTCDNMKKDGTETDVDCGGPQCLGCPDGGACATPSDCMSGICKDGACEAPTCDDTVKNGEETDADCGGPACPDCPDDKGCEVPTDCESGVCNVVCQAPTCMDLVKNAAETDTDCGGGSCPGCGKGKTCKVTSDCADGVCVAGSCL